MTKKILVVSLLIVVMACSTILAASSDPKFLTVGTASTGGAFYPIGIAIADIITNKVGISTTAQITGGAVENNFLIQNGTADLAITMGFMAYNAVKGIEPYKEKMPDINVLFSGLSKGVFHVVVNKNSSIRSIKDLKGKRVALGPAGGGAIAVANDVFKFYGISSNDFKPVYISYEQAADALTDGNIDAIVVQSAAPAPAITQLTASNKQIRILSLEDDYLNKILKEATYYSKIVLPETMYGIEQATTIYTSLVVVVNRKMSQDLAYRITKALFENVDVIKNSHPSANELDIKEAVKALPAPLHPGAVKYYKEKGIL